MEMRNLKRILKFTLLTFVFFVLAIQPTFANTEDYIKCQMKKCINLYFSQNSDYIIRLKNIKNKIDSFFDDDLQKKAEWYEILKTFEFLLKNDNGSSIDNMRFKDKYFQNMSRDKIKSILQVLLKLDVVEEFLNVYEIKK